MDIELHDLITRTRPTILEILKNRGYNVEPYQTISPKDLIELASSSSPSQLLRICAEKVPDGPAPMERCYVLYWTEGATRSKLENEVNKLWDPENPDAYKPTEDEIIVVLSEPFNEVFHTQAIKTWNKIKARVSFFNIKQLVSNPAYHTYVPPHRKLTANETTEVITKLSLRSKMELPRILYHVDIQTRVLGLVPGDVVEIRRPSPTSGEYIMYRVCTVA